MAFAVTCKSCQARFLLNDDLLRRKVAGRIVTVRCRQCHAPIEVDASQVDAPQVTTAPKPEPPGPPPALTPVKATLAYKPAPSPPRPAKSSTLIGIGSPSRPGAAPEMVALSPGLLNLASPAAPGPRGFPEPPPPPSSVEDISGDWEIPEPKTPLMSAAVDAAPESVDDFIEELPPSLPPPVDEEQPSSVGTPALSALVHHDVAPKPRREDFFASAGNTAPLDLGAPTIDVSSLAASAPQPAGPSIDISSFDAPLTGKQTLPLFGLSEAAPASSPPTGSLSPASMDRPAPSQRPDSARSRRNVVAPVTKSDPPAAPSRRRSVLALPVLLVLAAAAGFLIWKRSSHPADGFAASEATSPTPTSARAPEPPPAAVEPAAIAVAAAPNPTASPDDVTFETTPRPAAKSAATAAEPSPRAPASPKLEERPAVTPKGEVTSAPVTPSAPEVPKPEVPKPEVPSEPAGPFDRAAAAASLTAAASAASACRKDGDPSGTASVVITFAPSGRVTSANIGGPPFAGTPTGGCIAAALRKARVPPFEGERVTVSKTIVVQ